MKDDWTDAERLAAEVLASGSDEALRDLLVELDRGLPPLSRSAPAPRSRSTFRRPWRESSFVNSAVDAAVILVAVGCIAVGTRHLAAPVAEARPAIVEAFEEVSLATAEDVGLVPRTAAVSSSDRAVSSREPITLQARNLEATVGRYRAVADMYEGRTLPCSQLRQSYREVEDAWTRYSIVRGRTYGDRLPDHLVPWDEALYEAVRDVDRQFTSSGCNRP